MDTGPWPGSRVTGPWPSSRATGLWPGPRQRRRGFRVPPGTLIVFRSPWASRGKKDWCYCLRLPPFPRAGMPPPAAVPCPGFTYDACGFGGRGDGGEGAAGLAGFARNHAGGRGRLRPPAEDGPRMQNFTRGPGGGCATSRVWGGGGKVRAGAWPGIPEAGRGPGLGGGRTRLGGALGPVSVVWGAVGVGARGRGAGEWRSGDRGVRRGVRGRGGEG